jgi:hypothetical protein
LKCCLNNQSQASVLYRSYLTVYFDVYYQMLPRNLWALQFSKYSDWLRAGRSGNRIPVGASFSVLVQTDSGAHPAYCTMGTGSSPGVESDRGVTLTPHPLLVPRSKNSRAIPLLSLGSFVACKKGETYLPRNLRTK